MLTPEQKEYMRERANNACGRSARLAACIKNVDLANINKDAPIAQAWLTAALWVVHDHIASCGGDLRGEK